MKLELGIMAGPESKAFLVDLTKLVERMEKAAGRAPKQSTAPTSSDDDADDAPDAADDADEDFAPKASKKAGKKAASFEDDADDAPAEEEEEEDFGASKKSKPKKITADQVNDACKAYAKANGANGVKLTKALLLKKFGTQSITDIDATKWPLVLKALGA